ncbi:MAG: hypothetical protein K6F44_01140, partial [Lachnospiraceae bacterium]|nr:hypothetical protein [Lachnospiraceae bacterium]
KGIYHAHYVFPTGFHGLSIPNEAFFKGDFSDSTMEQLENAIEAVKAGKGINVSPERVAELKTQFPDKDEQSEHKAETKPTEKEDSNGPLAFRFPEDPVKAFADVAMWPDLAMVWMSRI